MYHNKNIRKWRGSHDRTKCHVCDPTAGPAHGPDAPPTEAQRCLRHGIFDKGNVCGNLASAGLLASFSQHFPDSTCSLCVCVTSGNTRSVSNPPQQEEHNSERLRWPSAFLAVTYFETRDVRGLVGVLERCAAAQTKPTAESEHNFLRAGKPTPSCEPLNCRGPEPNLR